MTWIVACSGSGEDQGLDPLLWQLDHQPALDKHGKDFLLDFQC